MTHPSSPRSHRLSRRDLLYVGGMGLGAAALGSLAGQAHGANDATRKVLRDKSVVLLFLQGGPPQIETFDPKFDVPEDNRSVNGELATKLPGVWFGGAFPKMAARADRLAIVRSFASGDAGHVQTPMLTGLNSFEATMGAIAARARGELNDRTGMPNHTVIVPEAVSAELKLTGSPSDVFDLTYVTKHYGAAGQLGRQYAGFMPMAKGGLLENLTLNVPREAFEDRGRLLARLDALRRGLDATPETASAGAFREQAADVLRRDVVEAFDLAKESPRTVARYDTSGLFNMADYHPGGRLHAGKRNQSRITNLLGRQLLMARRLCEAGCGFVTVVDCGWDFHGNVDNPNVIEGISILGPQVDHAVAAFMDDVAERGLTDKILLVITGEMGRVPVKGLVGGDLGPGGTGHNAKITPLVFAGGGLKMGQVIGQSDRTGSEPATTPYGPQHLLATALHTLVNPAELRITPGALPINVGQLILNAQPIPELF